MSIGAFTDKNHRPTESEITRVLGPMREQWQLLGQWIREHCDARVELHFMYGKNYGWACTFRVSGALLACLYPADDTVIAQVILNREALKRAQLLNLGTSTRDAIARARPYAEGKWLFIRITGAADARDVEQLLALKRPPDARQADCSKPSLVT